MNEKIKNWGIGLVIIGIFLLSGCATIPSQNEPLPLPKFDFIPPPQVTVGNAQVSFAIISPQYSEYQPWTEISLFNNFCSNMSLDFQELLIARGFTTKGPYRSYDEMTFPDKKICDLVLVPLLGVKIDILDTKRGYPTSNPFDFSHRLSGTAYISGRVTLSINESLSGERMWFKSIELPQKVVQWQGEQSYTSDKAITIPTSNAYTDPGFIRAMSKPLEEFYTKILKTSWDYLNPEEMALVKKQSQEIKNKKIYQ